MAMINFLIIHRETITFFITIAVRNFPVVTTLWIFQLYRVVER